MDISNMKNIVVLKNLPSNLVEEAIVVLKENKKAKRYQYVDREKNKNGNIKTEKSGQMIDDSGYIVSEAESVISQYIANLEKKSPKWKNNMKQLEKKYKKSLALNFLLGFTTVVSILLSLI